MDVVETGAGTRRITEMLALLARLLRVSDRSAHMLSIAEARLKRLGWLIGRPAWLTTAACQVITLRRTPPALRKIG
ncbi:MAG: hypothetical protein AB1894_28205 [Chloroflexota bacterium]